MAEPAEGQPSVVDRVLKTAESLADQLHLGWGEITFKVQGGRVKIIRVSRTIHEDDSNSVVGEETIAADRQRHVMDELAGY
jgi:hypothetical protein